MKEYRVGIDIGSTTVKLVVLGHDDKIVFSEYRRHQANTQLVLSQLLREAEDRLGQCGFRLKITGSGSINLAKALELEFIQEVVAVAAALRHEAPQTDVAIELGGEDAKIIYFTGGLEERMNGVCAGGTGAFIDQMAALLQTDASGLNREAGAYSQIYPIAEVAELAKPFLSLGNQYGEGWFLTGEMAELLREGVDNIVCIQPFACLPNHVVGKGVIKALKASYPRANIVAVDYDPGASEVNQLNRIKLILSTAKERLGG